MASILGILTGCTKSFAAGALEKLDQLNSEGHEKFNKFMEPAERAMEEQRERERLERLERDKVQLPPGKIEMVYIKGGIFEMGSSSDYDNRAKVTVKSFYIGKYQVTQREWKDVMGNNPSGFEGDNLPADSVNWFQAVEFCNKRSLIDGLTPAYRESGDNIICDWNANGYRLPTEAEWEYAASGGGDEYKEFSKMDTLNKVSWNAYNTRGNLLTQPVGTKAANSFGLHDMLGNVWEWCWDKYTFYDKWSQYQYPNYANVGREDSRILRGGSWEDGSNNLISTRRWYMTPTHWGWQRQLPFTLCEIKTKIVYKIIHES
jgi:formylglycine-generating enzyme required for sulfatase activity